MPASRDGEKARSTCLFQSLKKAWIIHVGGGCQATAKPAGATGIMNRKPMALQLHCPRTSTDIGVEKNATVAFPVPIGVLKNWMKSSS